jgi:F-box-like
MILNDTQSGCWPQMGDRILMGSGLWCTCIMCQCITRRTASLRPSAELSTSLSKSSLSRRYVQNPDPSLLTLCLLIEVEFQTTSSHSLQPGVISTVLYASSEGGFKPKRPRYVSGPWAAAEAITHLDRVGLISFPRITIRSLPDNVLLDIFDLCQMPVNPVYEPPQWWHALVHVCGRWRSVVFQSPLRLHLELVCNANTPVKKTLDVWPLAFPILIKEPRRRLPLSGANIIAALEHHDRVSEIDLYTTSTVLNRLYKVMKKPYPVLRHLHLNISKSKSVPVLRDTFSAPRLESLKLFGIPFPALPKFLPSCHDLVNVELWSIPNTGYISSEAMATALSTLTKLQFILIGFESPASRPDPTNRPPSSLTRIVLPALSRLWFHGASEYFEDLVARIDTPAITTISTWFFNQLDFDIPHFLQFISRTQIPGSLEGAKLRFVDKMVHIHVGHRDPPGGKEFRVALSITISCHTLDWQVACVAQICSKISPFLSNVEQLLIATSHPDDVVFSDWEDYVDNPQWLEIFHAFSALQHMQIPPRLGQIIASALQELTGERVMDALPMLRHLYLPLPSESTQRAIEPFISSRQRSNCPFTVYLTEMD